MRTQRYQKKAIDQMFVELDPRSQSIARLIDYKYGSRIAARFIVRTHKLQQQEIIVKKSPSGFWSFFHGLWHRAVSLFASNDSEGDSRSLKIKKVMI